MERERAHDQETVHGFLVGTMTSSMYDQMIQQSVGVPHGRQDIGRVERIGGLPHEQDFPGEAGGGYLRGLSLLQFVIGRKLKVPSISSPRGILPLLEIGGRNILGKLSPTP